MVKITKAKGYWVVEKEDGSNLKGSVLSVSFSNEEHAIDYKRKLESDIEKQVEFFGSGYPVIPPSQKPLE